jgi:hypothetical protein
MDQPSPTGEMTAPRRRPLDFAPGDATGLAIPAHVEAFRQAGAGFLTEAFHAFGSLDRQNRVTAITRAEPCAVGSTGQKLALSVAYARPEPGLHGELFVKFSRDFDDPVRDDRGKFEMDGEIRLAAMSRLEGFPVRIPKAYFADQHGRSHTGLLVTERIAFGEGGVEPLRPKCMDHLLDEPIAYYRPIVRSLARIAAAHRSGRLGAAVGRSFPFDPAAAAAANRIADAPELRARVRRFAAFAERAPQLLPAHLADPRFFEKLEREVGLFADHQDEVNRFQQSDPALIALCHWNANIDNAWFWRDAHGERACGLMDWGHAGQMNLAFSLWGCLSGAGLDIWDDHLEELIALFVGEFAAQGGGRLDAAELRLHLDLYVVMMGLQYFLESPDRILANLPETLEARGPRDERIQANETVRNQLHISTNALNLWARRDPVRSLERVLARVAAKV